MDNHLWMFSKFYFGELWPHDNIMLIFLVVSLSMIGNVLVVRQTKHTLDHTTPVTIKLDAIGWCLVTCICAFSLSCCFETILRNIRMKARGKIHDIIFSPEEGYHYVYFGMLLHRIFVNLGLHFCVAEDDNIYSPPLTERESRPKSRRQSKFQFFIPEVLQPFNADHLLTDWEPVIRDVTECGLCRINQCIGPHKKEVSFSLLHMLQPFIKLDTITMSVLESDKFCFPFRCATDHYIGLENVVLKSDISMQVANKFVDSLMCMLQIFKMVFLDNLELKEITTVYHLYKSFAYDILHQHVHELLISPDSSRRESGDTNRRESTISGSDSGGENSSMKTIMNHLTMELHNHNHVCRRKSSELPDVKLKLLSSLKPKHDLAETFSTLRRISMFKKKEVPDINSFDGLHWRMVTWRSDLDSIINMILDSIILIQQNETKDSIQHDMDLIGERVESIVIYTEQLLLECTYHSERGRPSGETDDYEMSPWSISKIWAVDEQILLHDLAMDFQAYYLSREIVVEHAIIKLEQDILTSLIDIAYSETHTDLSMSEIGMVNAILTHQVISKAKEELNIESEFPVFAFSRVTFFVTVAKFLKTHKDFVTQCPTLVAFFEVSQTDINHSVEFMFCLIEIILYRMSQSGSASFAPKRSRCLQEFLVTIRATGLCGEVSTISYEKMSELTTTFLSNIIDSQKDIKKLNLMRLYLSAILEQFSEQLSSLIEDCLRQYLRLEQFADLCREEPALLQRNCPGEKWTQTSVRHNDIIIGIDLDPKSFFEIKEQELKLTHGYISILFMITYRVWFQEDQANSSGDFLWQFYSVYFRNNEKPFPHYTKIIIQLLVIALIIACIVYFPYNEQFLKGSFLVEWFALLLLSLVINTLILEPLKVLAIIEYQNWKKKKERTRKIY